jgi:hypothetical protein
MIIMWVFIKFMLNFICSTNKFDGFTNHRVNSKVQWEVWIQCIRKLFDSLIPEVHEIWHH